MSRHLVISAVNFSEGGPLTVLIDSIETAAETLGPEWEITALVHDHSLIQNSRIRTIAFPQSKLSWLTRLRLEWWDFSQLSKKIKPDLWLSLHDMTPRVMARRQAVYCHNPSPFYKASITEAIFDYKFFIFNKLYIYLYKAFIKNNHSVIVQSSWLRSAFLWETRHPNIVVAYPSRNAAPAIPGDLSPNKMRVPTKEFPLRLLYPSLPRVFKNFEVIMEAIRILPLNIIPLVDLRLTFDGTENKWAAELASRYRDTPGISLIGRQDRAQMTTEYEKCDAVLFPSRLETWGLPIMEAKAFNKPLLVADLPYAHETVGNYNNVSFAAANDAQPWSDAIVRMAHGTWEAQAHEAIEPEQPFMENWPALWQHLVKGL